MEVFGTVSSITWFSVGLEESVDGLNEVEEGSSGATALGGEKDLFFSKNFCFLLASLR